MRRRRGACMDRAEDYHRNLHRADAAMQHCHPSCRGTCSRYGRPPAIRVTSSPSRLCAPERSPSSRHHSQRHVVIGTPSSAAQRHRKRRPLLPQTPSAALRAASASRPAPGSGCCSRSYLGEQRPESDRSRSATRAEFSMHGAQGGHRNGSAPTIVVVEPASPRESAS